MATGLALCTADAMMEYFSITAFDAVTESDERLSESLTHREEVSVENGRCCRSG